MSPSDFELPSASSRARERAGVGALAGLALAAGFLLLGAIAGGGGPPRAWEWAPLAGAALAWLAVRLAARGLPQLAGPLVALLAGVPWALGAGIETGSMEGISRAGLLLVWDAFLFFDAGIFFALAVLLHLAAIGGMAYLRTGSSPAGAAMTEWSLLQIFFAAAAYYFFVFVSGRIRGLERDSLQDEVTGLYNSRFLHQILRREVYRTGRSGRPVSLLFLDVDYFKQVNDVYGHLVGTALLAELGELFRSNLRESDFCTRYGGDEFALVLPETDKAVARQIGERVLESIRSRPFGKLPETKLRITASIGVATAPADTNDAVELIRKADEAMYAVKNSGRDGIREA